HQRVARQWAITMQILLDDLETLPPGRWISARYDALAADPAAEIGRICAALEIGWDRPLGAALPYSRHTVSPPKAEKWRARAAEIEAVLPELAPLMARAAAAAAR